MNENDTTTTTIRGPRDLTVATVAGYMRACWDYAIHRDGRMVIGVRERTYPEVFVATMEAHGLTGDTETLDEIEAWDVVIPRSVRQSVSTTPDDRRNRSRAARTREIGGLR